MIDRDIVENAEEPAGKATLRVVGGEARERARKGLLRQILGQRAVPDHPGSQVHGRSGVPGHERPIGVLIAVERLPHEVGIAGRHE